MPRALYSGDFTNRVAMPAGLVRALALLALPTALVAQRAVLLQPTDPAPVPSLVRLIAQSGSELAPAVSRFETDRAILFRRYSVEFSAARRGRMRSFYEGWRGRLREVDFDKLSQEGRVDYVLLDARLRSELLQLDRAERRVSETTVYAPFAPAIAELQDARRRLEPARGPESARTLNVVAKQIDSLRKSLDRPGGAARTASSGATIADTAHARRVLALRSIQLIELSRTTLENWYNFYNSYDPGFTWWVAEPYKRATDGLRAYTRTLREKVLGVQEGDEEPIVGDPIGSDALAADLALEFIAYSPRELLALAEREFAWGEAEMKKAAKEMGFGDWHDALEKVKSTYVEPGRQTELALRLAREATEYVKANDLVTVPAMAEEIWRMEMLTPTRSASRHSFSGVKCCRSRFRPPT